uniref:Uncharacterized protein n=1 Tax=Rhizophora mucronata TaxID=61149 RepID=A0A2P2M126_RHIMU
MPSRTTPAHAGYSWKPVPLPPLLTSAVVNKRRLSLTGKRYQNGRVKSPRGCRF